MPTAIDIAIVTGAVWLAGLWLLLLLFAIPATRANARELFGLMLPEGLILAVAAVTFIAGPIAAMLALALTGFRVGWESGKVAGLPEWPTAAVGAALVGIGALITWPPSVLIAVFIIPIAVLLHDKPAARLALFPGVPLLLMGSLVTEPDSLAFMLMAFLLVEIFDCFALLGGRLFGEIRLIPTISPSKTVEGLLMGVLLTLLAASGLSVWFGLESMGWVIACLAVPPLAFLGDLLGSVIKRKAGVKDYPAILPQGGLLDILDAWLVTAPVFTIIMLAATGLAA